MQDELKHYGTPRHSGRYPWGSGKNPQRSKNFMSYANELKKEGLSEAEIAKVLIGPNATSTQYRARYRAATNEVKKENMDRANRLRNEKQYSPAQIAKIMGVPDSTVRTWLKGEGAQKKDKLQETADILKKQVDEKGYIDIGRGVELSLGTTATTMNTAVEMLRDQGYSKIKVQVDQMGTAAGKKTTVLVLAPPGTTYKDVNMNKDKIQTIEKYTNDSGDDVGRLGLPPVHSVSSDRVMVRYGEDGGTNKDGVIEIRRGLEDLSLGNAKYAQVRIGVDGTHYMKGMAIYGDNMPDGVDIIFNSNKSRSKGKLGVMKEMKLGDDGLPDKDNPFGSAIKSEGALERIPRYYIDKNGKKQVSPINVVREEGDWKEWSNTLASQMLSKQPKELVTKQLDLSYKLKKSEFDDIMAVSNPVVKRELLEGFQSDCDSTAVHLDAAKLPRQSTHVLLPIPELKENEIYAPKFETGEKVALIRYPHGGIFEIPILTVNNNNKQGKTYIGSDSPDAVGINPKAAVQLSGADFDGDTALVIPTGGAVNINSKPMLKGLIGFDGVKEDIYGIPKGDERYERLEIKKGSETEHVLMGKISNLITDMTLKGANDDELARAVRHSMVIIDTAKHHLDYKQSEKDNNIKELINLYQDKPNGQKPGGASTIISSAKSELRIPRRDLDIKRAGNPQGWDPETGEILYTDKKGDTYIDKKGKIKTRTETTTKMAYAKDANELVSSFATPIERAYANYANQLKGLANEARKSYLATKVESKDPAAAKAYKEEVDSLNRKLQNALRNAPRERQAQLYADKTMEIKRQAVYPDKLEKDEEKKLRAKALAAGRARYDAHKDAVVFSEREWEAVQARAISPTKLRTLLKNADLDQVKKLATPKSQRALKPAQVALAKSMLARGYSLKEVGDHLGVSASTISNAVN